MKKNFFLLAFLVASIAANAQINQTPNYKFSLPPIGYQNWGTLVNNNFSALDTFLAQAASPYQGIWSNTTNYVKGTTVKYNGILYQSLQSPNVGNEPDISSSFWISVGINSASDIVSLFGSCTSSSGTQSLGADGNCHTSSGGINSGTNYSLSSYSNVSGNVLSASNITTDSTGNNLNIPNVNKIGNLAMGSIGNVALVGAGDSRMAGSTLVLSGAPASGRPSVGLAGDQDLISRLSQMPQFKNRTGYVYNGARGGSTCTQMTTDYTANHVNLYKPGGADAPNATVSYLFILMGENDLYNPSTSSLVNYQACMGAYLNQATLDGFNPVLLTSYSTAQDSDALNTLLQTYNQWLTTLDGITLNGKLVRTIDIDSSFPWSLGSAFYYVGNPANLANTVYPITSYSITNSGGVSTITFTTTASTTNTGFLGSGYGSIELGGFLTSTQLNYQMATYVSGAGTQTITATLAYPLASTSGTVTENGYSWSWNPTISNVPAGKHLTADGVNYMAKIVNEKWGISGLGSLNSKSNTQDYENPLSGLKILAAAFCVEGASNLTYSQKCPAGLRSGDVQINHVPQNLGTNNAGFYGGDVYFYLGGNADYFRSYPTSFTFATGIYTGPAGAVGQANVNNGGNTLYTVGDSITISGAGSGTATATVLSVNGTNCNIQVGCTGTVALLSPIVAGGSGYSQASGVTTTDTTTPSATGLTVNVFLSQSQYLSMTGPGATYAGGAFKVSAYGVTSYTADSTGELASATGGAILTATVANGGTGYVTGDTVTLAGGSNTATATVTASGGVVTALTIVSGGNSYYRDLTAHIVTGGSGTGLTYFITTASSLGGRMRLGSTNLLSDNGVGQPTAVLSGPIAFAQGLGFSTSVTPVAGAAAGTSPTIACASNHTCSAVAGTINLTVGASPTTGVLLTITDAKTHQKQPDCMAHITLTASPYTEVSNYLWSYSTTVWTLNIGTSLTASTAYTITYNCPGY